MSDTSKSLLQPFIDLRAKNLTFFKNTYPGIHSYFANYQMSGEKVDILPEIGEVDIISDKQHLYAGAAQAYAKKEVATFLSSFDYGSRIETVKPLDENTYQNPRTFAINLTSVYRYYYKKEKNDQGYLIPDFFPLIVFMGCGLGQHIRVLTSVRTIRHGILLEHNMDRFAASLYSVDWERILTPFLRDPNRSFQFVLVPTNDEEQLFSALWNTLLPYCPLFPLTALFYNHKASPLYDRLSDRVNADLYVHLFSFGNFDDEVNQLNNALHNFRNNIPLLGFPTVDQLVPVCVVGAGPSLDRRADDLRRLQEAGALVISCGTALASLRNLAIKPDIQVELESDYLTYRLQKQSYDEDYMKGICLIGAVQLNPLLVSLFADARLFFKDDGSLAHIFADPDDMVANATPTCTNAALAFVSKYRFRQAYLFGLDYGFPDKKSHHAKGSIYYADSMQAANEEKYKDTIAIPAAGGGMISTTPFLYASKRRTENLIRVMAGLKLYNCSDGASLAGADWIPQGQPRPDKDQFLADKRKFLTLFSKYKQYPVAQRNEKAKCAFIDRYQQLTRVYLFELEKNTLESLSDFVNYCTFVRTNLTDLFVENPGLYFFVRGSLWHFLFAGYSHLLSLDESEHGKYCRFWCDQFGSFLTKSYQVTKNIWQTNSAIWADELVAKSIAEPRDCDREELLADLDWSYEHIIAESDQYYFEE
ncbi:MAG: hypothetical protein CSA50_07705 [Gammaproteobacteria bacterium]|nr:MAG: hypothetical protein CSA50_07705 [Gammaproteobacteria bacterium]